MNKILLAATLGIAALAASGAAQAHVNFDIGIGVPAYVAAPRRRCTTPHGPSWWHRPRR